MKPDMKPVITMVQYFGLATVIFGVLTGTLFGIPVPEQFAFLAPYKELFIDNQEMFDLAIYVGAGHVLFGMCIKAANQVKQNGWGYALSTIGWFFLIVSSALYLMILPEGTKEAFTIPYYFIGGISAVFILFLNNPKGNIFANFGAGLWDVYSNITGLLGDLLSYIRLFALGLSSAILGYVFNQMATTLSPATPVLGELVFVIILVFGHSINIFMSSLGSLVHPMRLIFVEFFKNAGFTGGGKEYKPFVKINK
jgi:V/A-type H+-transporting ATPase subunit I